MASAWGDAWASAWGDSWGSIAAAVVTATDTHDGGPSRKELDKLRQRMRAAAKAREANRQEREHQLAEALDRAYRRVVLNEPDVALEVAEAIAPAAAADADPNELPTIDWQALTDILDKARQVLAILERGRVLAARDAQIAAWNAADEDDTVMLLLLS